MNNRKYNVAIVGASGLVGREMLDVLEENNFPIENLKLLASNRSAGQLLYFKGKEYKIEELTEDSFKGMDLALFSAGGTISKKYAPIAAKSNCVAIDNSSAWRMDKDTPLVVPEVNHEAIKEHKGIIANPNCSTIQLVLPLKHIHDAFGLKRMIVSTYQSISGAGQQGLDQLKDEINGQIPKNKVSELPIAYNTVFHNLSDNGNTEEENKMINEPRKIMSLPDLKISVTCVRLPIIGGHGESVNLELEKNATKQDILDCLKDKPGITIMDEKDIYPTPLHAHGKNDVFVGRIREDESCDNGISLWVVADNIRKGAATNTVQIAEKVIELDALMK